MYCRPISGGETGPGVGRIVGRMGTAVQVDRAVRPAEHAVHVISDHVEIFVKLGVDARIARAPERILRGMRHALMFGNAKQRAVVTERAGAGFVVDRKADVIDQCGTGCALR